MLDISYAYIILIAYSMCIYIIMYIYIYNYIHNMLTPRHKTYHVLLFVCNLNHLPFAICYTHKKNINLRTYSPHPKTYILKSFILFVCVCFSRSPETRLPKHFLGLQMRPSKMFITSIHVTMTLPRKTRHWLLVLYRGFQTNPNEKYCIQNLCCLMIMWDWGIALTLICPIQGNIIKWCWEIGEIAMIKPQLWSGERVGGPALGVSLCFDRLWILRMKHGHGVKR